MNRGTGVQSPSLMLNSTNGTRHVGLRVALCGIPESSCWIKPFCWDSDKQLDAVRSSMPAQAAKSESVAVNGSGLQCHARS